MRNRLISSLVFLAAAVFAATPTLEVSANMVMSSTGGGSPPIWTLIAHTFVVCNDGSGNCNTNAALTTPAINTTGADLIVAGVTFFANPPGAGCFTPNVISDSKSNTWSTAKTVQNNGTSDGEFDLFYVHAPTVGSGHTFSYNKECFSSIYVLAFSGSVASPLDVTSSGSNASTETSQASGSITPTQSGDLIIAGLLVSGPTTSTTVNSGITQADAFTTAVNAQTYGTGLGYFAQSTAAAINPTWSWSTAAEAAALVASFKSH
jgi:hypothetical protein